MSLVPPFQQQLEQINPAWFNLTPQPKRHKIFPERIALKQSEEVIDQVQRLGQKMIYIRQKIESIPQQNTEFVLKQTIKYKDIDIQDKNKLIVKNKQMIQELETSLFNKNQEILDLNAHLYFIQNYGQSIPFSLPYQ